MVDVVDVPVLGVPLDDPELLERVQAVSDEFGLEILEIEIEGTPSLAFVDPSGLVACYVPMQAGDEPSLRALIDMWDVMQSRPALLN